MAANQNNTESTGEWRQGRPSFKAFYPEYFLLALVTIAFMALAMKLSCNELKKAKSAESPEAASVETTFVPLSFEPQRAFAQDASIDELEIPEDVSAEIAAEPVVDVADSAQAEPVADAEPIVDEEPVDIAPEPVAPETTPAATSSASPAKTWSKIVWIWIICMIAPLALWIWRGWAWICAVYGVYYELKVDPDNIRASTFLTTRGIFSKKTDSMHIGAIKDIQSSQSLFQKYFRGGVGTVTLFTKDLTDGKVVMDNMPEPSRVFDAFDKLRRHYWGRGGFNTVGGDYPEGDGGMGDTVQ
ncbi:MAG: PH domain-containing protein [Thermoguttaceae bacterium]